MARETLAELRETIAALRAQLDAQLVVSVGSHDVTVPATLREVAQCAAEGSEIRVHGMVGRGAYA